MIERQQLFTLLNDALQAYSPFYQEGTTRLLQESGAPNTWFNLNSVRAKEPHPFTVEEAQQMFPYGSLRSRVEALDGLVEDGFLEAAGIGSYQLAGRGREVIEGFFRAAHEGLSAVEPLPADEMVQLRDLLKRIVQATLNASEPADKPSLLGSRWTDPGDEAPLSAQADQYITDLLRFRDDAHIAAWRPYTENGQVWETLTYVWREDAGTAAELAEQLPGRGYTEDDYATALEILANRGWIERPNGGYQVTDQGRRIRDSAEDETNRIFFGPWTCLDQGEQTRLGDSLVRLKVKLEMLAEKQRAADS